MQNNLRELSLNDSRDIEGFQSDFFRSVRRRLWRSPSLAMAIPRAMIVASADWNDTGIDLIAGARYSMTAMGTWHDRQFRAGPEGVPPQNWVQRIFSPLLRFPNGHYMTLIGCIDQDMGSAFAIGTNANYKATRNGRLWCFANDVRFAYGNNSGVIELIVDRNYRTTGPDGRLLNPMSVTPSTLSR